ncbi:MAG: response regulator [Planctomycetales bacterium]|nr:response regulator [Planctomycetales bacterium]
MTIIRKDRIRPSVLIVDPDPLMLTAMGAMLDQTGYRALMARSQSVALELVHSVSVDVVVLSIDKLVAGCELAQQLRTARSSFDAPIIFLVPQLDATWSKELAAHGGVYSMLYPTDPSGLLELIERVLWLPHLAANHQPRASSHLDQVKDWIKLSD